MKPYQNIFKNNFIVILTLAIQQLYLICGKTLPTNNNNADSERKDLTSYYQPNIYGPDTYAFGFEVNDKVSSNIQFRDERRYANGTVKGSYGYLQPDGSVMVTHFLANREHGYLSQTQNFLPGDELKWHENWPDNKPSVLMKDPLETVQPEMLNDEKEKINLTSILLPVEPIEQVNGIDLNPSVLEKELVNPAVLKVINGEAPLVKESKKQDNSIGFETINKFIPSEFPIAPFELPSEDFKTNNSEASTSKYDSDVESQRNSNKTSSPNAVINMKKLDETMAKSISLDKNSDWYDKVINQIRQEYFENATNN